MKHLLLTTIAAVVLVGTAFGDPIHDAAIKGDVAGIKAELDKSINVDVKMRDGSTSLHLAAFFNRKEVVKLLMAEGAEINTTIDGQLHGAGRRIKGKTPLDLAVEKKHTEIANLLRKHGGKHGTINDAVAGGYIQAVEEHLAAGADVNSKDWYGYTPLHIAAARNSPIEIAELLLANGADVNAKDNFGSTPLHIAADEGCESITELLLSEGVNVNAKDKAGETPLNRALVHHHLHKENSKKKIALLLIGHDGKTGEELAMMPRLVQHGRFAFSFDAKEGKVYEVQDSFDLLNWEVIKTYTGTGETVRFDEERDHDPPKIFYRVKVVE